MTSSTTRPHARELLPCPFCGGVDLRITTRHIENAPGYEYTVFEIGHVTHLRMECTAAVSSENQAQAFERWNRRAPTKEPAA